MKMRPSWLAALLAVPALSSSAGTALAAEEPFLQAALLSHGGASAVSLESTVVMRGPVKIHFGPMPLEGERIVYRSGRDHLKVVSRVKFRGSPSEFISTLDGKTAWLTFMGKTYDFPTVNARTDLAHDLEILQRAAAPGASVKELGIVTSGDRRLQGFELTENGAATKLLFDPETKLLAEMEYKAMEARGEGKSEERVTRKVFGDYRPHGGAPYPHSLTVFKDGVLETEWKIASIERGEPLELSIFSKPQEEDERLYSEEFAN